MVSAGLMMIAQLMIGAHSQAAAASTSCPAALEQMQTYRVVAGDTLASVAATYRLQPATLTRLNPNLGSLSPGAELLVPPFDGQVISVSPGASWQSLAEQYSSRADLLFEVNGCVAAVPSRIFVPGALTTVTSRPQSAPLSGYPLAEPADITSSYGWQPHSTRDELVFNSGIAFAIPNPTEVLAVESGTVAFAREQVGYGLMVVINHAQGLQTRYINLSEVAVAAGQAVAAGATVGSIGGDASTFLYFEVRTNSAAGWIAQDPGKYLPALELR